MTTPQLQIAEAATALADRLPFPVMQLLAKGIVDHGISAKRSTILGTVSHAGFRDAADEFLLRCQQLDLSADWVASSVITAARAEQIHRQEQVVELVWTGPESQAAPFRHTQQAVIEVFDRAEKRITLICYSVYNIPNVQQSLVRAARRGVRINVVVETPNKLSGKNTYDTLQAIGEEVAACSEVYYWPEEQRERTENKTLAKLHAKCAVSDGERLFVSSANLTEHAFTVNMELGVLISGGGLPREVENQVRRLLDNKCLLPVTD